MPASLKRSAANLLALSLAFCVFFYASKHQPALSRNNPFVEDPYDAVGSFAIQFAVFSSALSLLRACRTYPNEVVLSSQRQLVATGQMTGSMAVIVTLVVDLLAVVRRPELWSAISPSLLGMMAGLLGWATISFASSLRDAAISGTRRKDLWRPSLPWFLVPMVIVAFYPDRFRHTLFGAIATVVVGALVLFLPLRRFALATAPQPAASVSNFAGDLLALVPSFRARHPGHHRSRALDAGSAPARPSAWLAPGTMWIGLCVLGVLIGCGLALAELREGSSALPAKRLLIVAVYAGLETTAVLLGFALLRKPLRLSVA